MRQRQYNNKIWGGKLREDLNRHEAKQLINEIDLAYNEYKTNPDSEDQIIDLLRTVNPGWGTNLNKDTIRRYKTLALNHLDKIIASDFAMDPEGIHQAFEDIEILPSPEQSPRESKINVEEIDEDESPDLQMGVVPPVIPPPNLPMGVPPVIPPPQISARDQIRMAKILFRDIKKTPQRFIPELLDPVKKYMTDNKIHKFGDLPKKYQDILIDIPQASSEVERESIIQSHTVSEATPLVFTEGIPAVKKVAKPPGKLQKKLAKDPVTINLVVRKKKAHAKCKLAPKIVKASKASAEDS